MEENKNKLSLDCQNWNCQQLKAESDCYLLYRIKTKNAQCEENWLQQDSNKLIKYTTEQKIRDTYL